MLQNRYGCARVCTQGFPSLLRRRFRGIRNGKPAGHSATGIARMRLPGRAHTPNRGLRGKRGKDYESPGSKAGAFGCPEPKAPASHVRVPLLRARETSRADCVRCELGSRHERSSKPGVTGKIDMTRLRGQ